MGRRSALGSEIIHRTHDPFAKLELPDPVYEHARNQWILPRDKPFRQGEAPAGVIPLRMFHWVVEDDRTTWVFQDKRNSGFGFVAGRKVTSSIQNVSG